MKSSLFRWMVEGVGSTIEPRQGPSPSGVSMLDVCVARHRVCEIVEWSDGNASGTKHRLLRPVITCRAHHHIRPSVEQEIVWGQRLFWAGRRERDRRAARWTVWETRELAGKTAGGGGRMSERTARQCWQREALPSAARAHRSGNLAGSRHRRLPAERAENRAGGAGRQLGEGPGSGTAAWRPSPAEPDGTFLVTFYRELRGTGVKARISGTSSATHDVAFGQLPTSPWKPGARQMAVAT